MSSLTIGKKFHKSHTLNVVLNIFVMDIAVGWSNHYGIAWISDFVTIFNCFVLDAQLEFNKKLGHYEYLLLVKRSFPVSFVP